jgi:hypothetical protein
MVKNKRVFIVTVSLLTVTALLSGLALSNAEGPAVQYKGTLDTWYLDTDNSIYIDAKVVESSWRLRILDETAIFKAEFYELNILEEEPGTYDRFTIKMKTDDIIPTADGYIISGMSYWVKNVVWSWEVPIQIIIDEINLPTQFEMAIPVGIEEYYTWTGSLTP